MDSTQALLFLDSDDRIRGFDDIDTSDVSFDVNFKANSVKRIALASYDFAVDFDNINENNNIAVIDNGLSSFPIELTLGKYTYSQLATQIQTQLNAAGLGVFTVSYVNSRYEITAPIPIKFISNPFRPTGKDWADMISIKKTSQLSLSFVGGVADIAYTNKLYVVCDDAHRFKLVSDESSTQRLQNVLGVVYLNEDSNLNDTIIQPKHATERLPWLKWINHKLLTELGPVRIVIRDDRGLSIPPSQKDKFKWSLELYIEEGFIM